MGGVTGGPFPTDQKYERLVMASRSSLPRTRGEYILYKTAELSQRRPRDAPNIWVH